MSKQVETTPPIPVKIAGIGQYIPKRIVTNQEIEETCGLQPGWCIQHLGIEERRWVTEETPSFMGAEAVKEAIANANLEPEDIDLILSASGTAIFERGLPDGGPLVQKQLGLENSGIPAFTLQNNDNSFIAAIEASAAWLTTGRYENILVVSSEIFSKNLDPENPEVYGLLGDGAAAAVITLTPENESSGIRFLRQKTYGQHASSLQSIMGFTVAKQKELKSNDLTLKMEPNSFKENALRYTETFLEEMIQESNIGPGDIDMVVPQQIGKFYLDYLKTALGIPAEKIITIMNQLGFCGAASLPMALYHSVITNRIKQDNTILLLGVGAGISVGGILLTL